MTPSGVFVIGAGGHGKVVVSTLQERGVEVLGVFDDDAAKWGGRLLGVPVLGGLDLAPEYADRGRFILAIGNNDHRARLAERFARFDWATAVHPAAYVHPSARLRAGVVVFAGAVVQPETVVGAHSIVNTGTTVDHDCEVGSYVHLAPGVHLAGGVAVGSRAMLGVGASVIPGVRIGEGAIVGAGSVVLRDVSPGETVVGMPAKPLQKE
ncbi:hexapeptide transferase [Oceanithermus desulfurans NBRC 100063]|uniref:Hexapeptide transferase n=1 Tax=Oceanithermus desulfurans NBRC 100063 TaxID=1227550 RepID=A0A511RM89_9DEIN|nr:hexapeptide transferase [Oceanithermus desulfurans NBRC 100063]